MSYTLSIDHVAQTPNRIELIAFIRMLHNYQLSLMCAKKLADELLDSGSITFDNLPNTTQTLNGVTVKYNPLYDEHQDRMWEKHMERVSTTQKLLEAGSNGDADAAIEFCKYVQQHGWGYAMG